MSNEYTNAPRGATSDATDLDTACEPGCYGEDPCRLCRLRSQRDEAREQLAEARAVLDARTAGQRLNERLTIAGDIVTTERTIATLRPTDIALRVKLTGRLATLRADALSLAAPEVPRG